MRARAFLWIALVVLSGCSRSEAPTPTPNATSNPTPNATPTPSASATPTPTTWSGHYTATAGTVSNPDHFHVDDASVGLGDGTMSVTLDDHGRASGAIDGALGASSIDGALHANDFGATLVPTDVAHGFSGTAVGTRDGDHIAGTMRLSLPMANVMREATFTLDRKP